MEWGARDDELTIVLEMGNEVVAYVVFRVTHRRGSRLVDGANETTSPESRARSESEGHSKV